jgi:hypothetical protein
MFMKKLWDRRWLLLSLGVAFIGGALLLTELGCGSENLQQFAGEVDRAWMIDQPSHLSPDRTHGGVRDGGGDSVALDTNQVRAPGSSAPTATENTKPQAPTVWKRDRHRPTFARVYVGDGNSLELVSMLVTVTIDGPRARTTVDHIFRNPHDKQLEGMFEYPLPTGATPSYFAMFLGQTRDTPPPRFSARSKITDDDLSKLKPEMFVKNVDSTDWGKLQEARIVAKDKALETYEDVVRTKIDPALLEYAGGNTFSGRVFPIPAKGYNRVIISYEETLPVNSDDMVYRFPMPDCKLQEMQLALEANVSKCFYSFSSQHAKPGERSGKDSVKFNEVWQGDNRPKGDAVFCFPNTPVVQTIAGRQGENFPQYIYTRIHPQLEAKPAAPFASHAVFLLDTSLSEHPDRFNVSMKLLKQILQNDPDIKQFNVLTFDVNAHWLEPRCWLENDSKGRDAVLSRLDGVLLEGATDLGTAWTTCARRILSNRVRRSMCSCCPTARSPGVKTIPPSWSPNSRVAVRSRRASTAIARDSAPITRNCSRR